LRLSDFTESEPTFTPPVVDMFLWHPLREEVHRATDARTTPQPVMKYSFNCRRSKILHTVERKGGRLSVTLSVEF